MRVLTPLPKRRLPPLFGLLLLSSACQSQPAAFSGELDGFVRDSVYLFRWNAGQWERVAATAVRSARFVFAGPLPEGIYLWGLSPQEGDLVWLSPKESPHVRAQAPNFFQNCTYEKSPTNSAWADFRRRAVELLQQRAPLSPEQQGAFLARVDSLRQVAAKSPYPVIQLYQHFYRPTGTLSPQSTPAQTWKTLLETYWEGFPWSSPLVSQTPETFSRLTYFWYAATALLPEDSLLSYATAWLSSVSPAVQLNAWGALLDVASRSGLSEAMYVAGENFLRLASATDPRRPQIEAFLKSEGALRKGQPAPDIALPDPDGNIRRLSELRGKWVLIDFWASWCRPCRMENPNVVRLYQKYHSRGFEIFGVSLDHNRDAWLQAIRNDNLTWTHVSDLKGWQSAAAQLYRVSGIPFTVMVDPEGRIYAKGLRGASLEATLQKLFP